MSSKLSEVGEPLILTSSRKQRSARNTGKKGWTPAFSEVKRPTVVSCPSKDGYAPNMPLWARLGSTVWWPARVVNAIEIPEGFSRQEEGDICVKYFGTNTSEAFAYLKSDHLSPYSKDSEIFCNQSIPNDFETCDFERAVNEMKELAAGRNESKASSDTVKQEGAKAETVFSSPSDGDATNGGVTSCDAAEQPLKRRKMKLKGLDRGTLPGCNSSRQLKATEALKASSISENNSMGKGKRERSKHPHKVLHGERVRHGESASSPLKNSGSSGKPSGRLNSLETVKKTKGKKTGADGYYFECMVCDVGGDLLCCDRCPGVYHLECLKPPLKRTPPGTWICPICRDSPGEVKAVGGYKTDSGPKLKKTKVTETAPGLSKSGAATVGKRGRRLFGRAKQAFDDADFKKQGKKRKQKSGSKEPRKKLKVKANGSSSSQSLLNCIQCGSRINSSGECFNSRSCNSCLEESKHQDLDQDPTTGGEPGELTPSVELVPPRHSKLKPGKCDICNKTGLVIFCNLCPRGFHKDCLYPPRKRAPKGPWTCPACGSGKPATEDKDAKSAVQGGLDAQSDIKGAEEFEMVVKQSKAGGGHLEEEVSETITPSRGVDRILGCRKRVNAETGEKSKRKSATPCKGAGPLDMPSKTEARNHSSGAKPEVERSSVGDGKGGSEILALVKQTADKAPPFSEFGTKPSRGLVDNAGSVHTAPLAVSDEDDSSRICQSSSGQSANPDLKQRRKNDDSLQMETDSGELKNPHAGEYNTEVICTIQGRRAANIKETCGDKEISRNRDGAGDLIAAAAAEAASDSRDGKLAGIPLGTEACPQRGQGPGSLQAGSQDVEERSTQKGKGIEKIGSSVSDAEDSSGGKVDGGGGFIDVMPAVLTESADKDERESPQSPVTNRSELEFLVKWNGMAHVHNEWLGEELLCNIAKRKLENFKLKHGCGTQTLVDNQWLVPQRVVARRTVPRKGSEVFIKWCGLPYDECTWESEEHPVIVSHRGLLKAYDRFERETPIMDELIAGDRESSAHLTGVRPAELESIKEQPSYLKGGSLFPHQMEAFNWLRRCWHRKQSVILADEMGLGKTISACSFVASLRHEFKVGTPCLVLVPLSTMGNWQAEFAMWAPSLNVIEYHGCAKARALIREYEWYANALDGGKKSTSRSFKFNVMLTTYEMVITDASQLRAVPWEALVVDEGHRLKNASSKLFTLLNTFSVSHRVLLTGTPWQNNFGEMFNLLNFIQPNLFPSSAAFQEKFSSLSTAEVVDELRKIVAPNMLRRLKKDVMQTIPPKMELVVPVDMSSVQIEYYRALLTRNYQLLRNGGKHQSMLNIVMQLRKVCNHPYLIPGTEPDSGTAEFLQEMRVKASAKLMLLHSMLSKLRAEGHRVLIFSQMTKLLDILEDYLIVEFGQDAFERVDGSVSAAERQASIARFNQDTRRFVFLLSTRACGLGINLATADTVIIYDSDFNPQSDIQAMNRAHRIGQSKTLLVYRLVVRASVEERILQLAKKKLMLDHLFANKTGSQKEIDDILRWGTEELFQEGRSRSDDHGSAGGRADEGEAMQKKKVGDLEDLYGDYYTQLGRTNVVWDDAAVVRLLDRINVSSDCNPEVPQGEPENDFLGAFKAWDWNGHDDTALEEQDVDAVVAEENGTERPLKISESEGDNQWDKLLRSRWETMQMSEAADLGRGKRTRKTVVYVEPNGQKSEDLPSESSDVEKEENKEPIFSNRRHKMTKLRARQKDRILQRRLRESGQMNFSKPPTGPPPDHSSGLYKSIDFGEGSQHLTPFDSISTRGLSERSSGDLFFQDNLNVNSLPSSLALQEVLTVSPVAAEKFPSKRSSSPPGHRTNAQRDLKRRMSYALKLSPIKSTPHSAYESKGNGQASDCVQNSWLGGVAPFLGNLSVTSQSHGNQMGTGDQGQLSGISGIPLSTVSRSLESGQSLSQLLPALRQSLKDGGRYCKPSESVAKLELQGFTSGRSESSSLDCVSQHQELGRNGFSSSTLANDSNLSRIRDELNPFSEIHYRPEPLGVGLELTRKGFGGKKTLSNGDKPVAGEDSIAGKRNKPVKEISAWSLEEKSSLKLKKTGHVSSQNSMSPNLSITLGLPSMNISGVKDKRSFSPPATSVPSSSGGSPGKLIGHHIRDSWPSRGGHVPSKLGFDDANPIEIDDDEFEPTGTSQQQFQISGAVEGSTGRVWHHHKSQEHIIEERGNRSWTDDELDALWSGVRRHGRGNWAGMLLDAKLCFLQSRSVGELAERWSEEERKVLGDAQQSETGREQQMLTSEQAGAARVDASHDVGWLSTSETKSGEHVSFLRTTRHLDRSLFHERDNLRQTSYRDDDSLVDASDLELNSSIPGGSLSSSRMQLLRKTRELKKLESARQGLNNDASLNLLSPSITPTVHNGLSSSAPVLRGSEFSAGIAERFWESGLDKTGRPPNYQPSRDLGSALNPEVISQSTGDQMFWHKPPNALSAADIELNEPGSFERAFLKGYLQRGHFHGTPTPRLEASAGGQSLGGKASESFSQAGGMGLATEHRRKARGGASSSKPILSSSDDSASSSLPHWLREAVKARSTPPQPPLPPAICAVVQAANMVYTNKKRLLPPLVHPGYPTLPPRDFPKKVDRKQQRLRKRITHQAPIDSGIENLGNSTAVNFPVSVKMEGLHRSLPPPLSLCDGVPSSSRSMPTGGEGGEVGSSLLWTGGLSGLPLLSGLDHPWQRQTSPVHTDLKPVGSKKSGIGFGISDGRLHPSLASTMQLDDVNSQSSVAGRRGRPWPQYMSESGRYRNRSEMLPGSPQNVFPQEKPTRRSNGVTEEGRPANEENSQQVQWLRANDAGTTGEHHKRMLPVSLLVQGDDGDDSTSSKTVSDPGVQFGRGQDVNHSDDASSEETISDDGTL